MQQIAFYILIASLTIASPGPGVLFTLTNTFNYNLRHAMAGIIGVAAGMGVISIVAASSIGAIITTSWLALLAVKIIGAAYLIYLGSKLFRSVPRAMNNNAATAGSDVAPSTGKSFRQGMLVSLLNPKAIVFFMALFPQFINPQQPFAPPVFDTLGYFLSFGDRHPLALRIFRTLRKDEDVFRSSLQ
ncbi:homoserine/homoserine lactone efflux protein [Raoultella ornithinolytica]|nr:homoserine/homoserine lactone efflux protein [Raoultella ornithinolytica]